MNYTPEQLREEAAQVEHADSDGAEEVSSVWLANILRAHADALDLIAKLERVQKYAVLLDAAVEQALSDDNLCGREIDELLANALAERPAGFP